MRIGAVYDIFPHYRVASPLMAMERRGHEVIWPDPHRGWIARPLESCDVVHTYRSHEPPAYRHLAALTRRGVPLVYDNDDDMAGLVAAEAAALLAIGQEVTVDVAEEGERIHRSTVEVARLARVFTTPSPVLADMYARAGVKHVEVIDNCLEPSADYARRPHEGIVIGWVAGAGHIPDVATLGLRDQIRRLLNEHRNARVDCVGVDLSLPERYRHDWHVQFPDLPQRIGGFDIGLAPMADTAANRARSDIKVKEYAARGIPWLASPVGPYRRLGEEHGGRLVRDDEWFDALHRLLDTPGDLRRLGDNGRAWAETQMIDAVADRWEQVFLEAAGSGR